MKNKTVYFREFNENDLSEVVDVYIKVFSAEPWNDKLTSDQITSYVNQMTDLNTFKGYIVREEGTTNLLGAALGFIRPWYMGKEYHLDSFYISNDYQGKGVGTQFLNFIKEQLKDIDIPTIILDTDRGYPAEYFYLDNGFEPSDSSIILYGDTSKWCLKIGYMKLDRLVYPETYLLNGLLLIFNQHTLLFEAENMINVIK